METDQTLVDPRSLQFTMWERARCHFIVLAVVWTLSSSASLRRNDSGVDITKTLQNVQDILDANPNLPRLTREDILSLLNNITAEDKIKYGINLDGTKEEEQVMVVLPYQPKKEGNADVSELYTKRPITKIVSASNEREELASGENEQKKKPNKSKKVTSLDNKNEEAKDLLTPNYSYLPISQSTKNDLANFNYDLLQQHTVDTSQIALPEVSAYEVFKPIPSASQSDKIPNHIKNILKSIDENDSNVKKNKPQTKKEDKFQYVDLETFPAEMTSLLTDLGLTKINSQITKSNSKPRKMSLETIKGESHLAVGPDPLAVDELNHVDDTLGNDLSKRQQSDNSTEAPEESSASSTTEEKASEDTSEGPNIADLENSFGGSDADDDPSEAELPPPRKNGFYYMLDWNSFLEVGDGDTKVNIRFDPKLGDPQRFIAVNVP